MKAEELMVGDWIQIVPDAPTMPNECHRVDWIRTGEIGLDNRRIVTYPYIQPIPLTEEILEKNGFVKWEHGYLWKERIGIGGQTTSASSPIEIIVYEDGHSFVSNPHDGKEYQGALEYVHELQHALRLCKIGKTIEL